MCPIPNCLHFRDRYGYHSPDRIGSRARTRSDRDDANIHGLSCHSADSGVYPTTSRIAGCACGSQGHVPEAWSSENLSDEAREKLHQAGIAPPPRIVRGRTLPMLLQQPLTCPYCGSQQTSMENLFGPTPCRAIAYCRQCHQPFEQFKLSKRE